MSYSNPALCGKIFLPKWHTYKILEFLTEEIHMSVKGVIFEMYLQINKPCAKKETASKIGDS